MAAADAVSPASVLKDFPVFLAQLFILLTIIMSNKLSH